MSITPPQLRVIHLDHTTEHGGAELALARLLENPSRGWQASLVIPEGLDIGVFDRARDAGVPVLEAGAAHAPGATQAGGKQAIRIAAGLVRQAQALRRLSAFREADVIHANSTRSAVYAALALLGRRTPLVVHLRDRIEPEALGGFGYLAFRRLVAHRATSFIANSRATADTISDMRRSSQSVAVVPSPIGIVRAKTLPATDPHALVHLGMVARLDDWKGQRELIEAFVGLDDRARLTFFGDASFGKEQIADDLRQLVSSLKLRNVEFAGFVGDVSAAIDSVDVCVQYSTRPEPLGQNVLQYLARGKTVVAADEGGPVEWVTNGVNGLLVAPRDVDALHSALARVIDSQSLRAQLSEGAMDTANLPTDDAIAAAHAAAFTQARAQSA